MISIHRWEKPLIHTNFSIPKAFFSNHISFISIAFHLNSDTISVQMTVVDCMRVIVSWPTSRWALTFRKWLKNIPSKTNKHQQTSLVITLISAATKKNKRQLNR